MSCGVGHRHGSYPTLLWLWCRQAAITLIQPLAWELPQARRFSPKKPKEKKKKKADEKTMTAVSNERKNCQPRILYSAKVSYKNESRINIFFRLKLR